MNNILQTLTVDPGGLEPLHRVTAAVRAKLPASASPRRDELIGALNDAGFKLTFTGGQLHVAGVRL